MIPAEAHEEHLTECAVQGCPEMGHTAMFLCPTHMGMVDTRLRRALGEAGKKVRRVGSLESVREKMTVFRQCVQQAEARSK